MLNILKGNKSAYSALKGHDVINGKKSTLVCEWEMYKTIGVDQYTST